MLHHRPFNSRADLIRCHESAVSTPHLSELIILLVLSFYRAMHFSAKRGIVIACRPSVRLSVCLSVRLSVCNVGGSGPHRLEILETNCTNN